MKKELQVGDWVEVRNTLWAGAWGKVVLIEDGVYHVSEGSIGRSAPIFNRNELKPMTPPAKWKQ